jgi:hypothetical protein
VGDPARAVAGRSIQSRSRRTHSFGAPQGLDHRPRGGGRDRRCPRPGADALANGKGTTSASDGERTPSTERTQTVPPTLQPPARLTASKDGFVVVLTWTPPSGEAEVDSYTISRDGKTIGSVPGTATSYQDETAYPGHTYAYTLRANASGGVSSSADVQVVLIRPRCRSADWSASST